MWERFGSAGFLKYELTIRKVTTVIENILLRIR